MEIERPHRSYIETLFSCRCPRCRQGKLFRNPFTFRFNRNMQMYDACPVCRQPTDIEVGFYYGTGYISYLAGLLITVISCILWLLLIGFSFKDKRFLFWLVSNSILLVVLQPWLMRFSRVFWLSCFVKYDPDWEVHDPEEPERINKDQMGNW